MDYYHLLYIIPAAAMLGTVIAHSLPVEIKPQFNALLAVICALICLYMPGQVDIALAICFPSMYINRFFGARWQGHEPAKYPDVKKFFGRLKIPHKAVISEFLTRAYPPPEEEAESQSQVRKYVPSLLSPRMYS